MSKVCCKLLSKLCYKVPHLFLKDLINSQEENEKLRSEFDRFKTEIRNEISRFIKVEV